LENLRRQEAQTKSTLSVNLQAVEALCEKMTSLQTTLLTKARATDVEALEARVSGTVERNLQTLSEELCRKESSANVKALADRLSGLNAEVSANDNQAKLASDDLSKKIDGVDQGVSKLGKQADADRERHNSSIGSLDRDLQTRSTKADMEAWAKSTKAGVEALSSKHISLEAAMEIQGNAAKTQNEEHKKLHARTIVLEETITTKAGAAELPRLQMQLAEHQAKHATLHSVGHEHASRLEQTRSVTDEHRTRLEVLEYRERDLQSQLTQKVEADHAKTAEISTMVQKEFYRREEIDAMMTRVWWRVGEAGKSPKGMLPQLPHSLLR